MTELDVVRHHHGPHMARLLRDAVLPAARAARRHGVRTHVERHWLHGPHLRVRVRPGPDGAGPDAVVTAADEVRAALTAHPLPAAPAVPDAELIAGAARLGRAELVPGPYTPLHPDGSVRVERPDERHTLDLLGSAEALTARADLLALGLPALATAADAVTDAGIDAGTDARVRVALAALTAHAAAYPGGLAEGHHTFLSHVEDFLHRDDPHGRIRARFAAQWARHGDAVTDGVARVAAGEPQGDLDRAWSGWVRGAWEVCRVAQRRGGLPAPDGPRFRARASTFDAATAAQWDPALRTFGEYHRRLALVDYRTGREADITCHRFAVNVLYRLLAVCDVAPLERLLAAYLLAAAAQRLTGRSWRRDLPPVPATTP